ncbi:ThiF family adenylyltransferase [Bacillaceae bacterium S4-13-58]
MSISRVDKFIRESGKFSSLEESRNLRNLPVNIILGDDDNYRKISIMAYTAVGLALRCFTGPINIYYKKSPLGLPNTEECLFDGLIRLEEDYGNFNRINFYRDKKPKGGPNLSLGTSHPNSISADSAGWVVGINHIFSNNIPTVAPVAIFAVCCAFAKVFKSAVFKDNKQFNEKWSMSLLDFSPNPTIPTHFEKTALDLGTIGLLGAGAIGSGFAYSLKMSGWSADLDIIDMDRYEQENLETTMLLTKEIAINAEHKAKALSNLLYESKNIRTNPIVTEITSISTETKKSRDIFICAVDNAKTRCLLDDVNAELLLNGAVGGSIDNAGHVLFTRHLDSDMPLSNLYNKVVSNDGLSISDLPEDVRNDECSTIAYNDVSMAAPFLGLASGSLLLLGCARKVMCIETDFNYYKFDLLKWQQQFQKEKRI